jgi:ABC-2 type transport system ATP-binding protein
VKEILDRLKDKGKLVILSTHQMAQVEALCDRIAMIDRGRLVLYGPLREIRRSYSGNAILVTGAGDWSKFNAVASSEGAGEKMRLVLREGFSPRDFLAEAMSKGVVPESYEGAEAPLEEIFVKVVGRDRS